jgi:hypothetical protein
MSIAEATTVGGSEIHVLLNRNRQPSETPATVVASRFNFQMAPT